MFQASVILPSHNRLEALHYTLSVLERRCKPTSDYEVIIVDDGSSDDTVVQISKVDFLFELKILEQQKQGPGAARNLGAAHASSNLLIFLDADMVPSAGMVEQYIKQHLARPEAILIGRILALPEVYQTLFDQATRMEMSHDLGDRPIDLKFYHLASGNFALGRELFKNLGGFDSCLLMTEDTDLGYRAQKENIPLLYCPSAVGYHNHAKTFLQRCAQVRASACWTARLCHKHPEIRSQLPIYQDIQLVDWQNDNPSLIIRKLGRRISSLSWITQAMESSIRFLEHYWPDPRLLRFFYWKILAAHRVVGYRQGL